jgi:hypothetical protein
MGSIVFVMRCQNEFMLRSRHVTFKDTLKIIRLLKNSVGIVLAIQDSIHLNIMRLVHFETIFVQNSI